MRVFIDKFMVHANMMDAMGRRETSYECEMPRAWVAFVQAILVSLREPILELVEETETVKEEEDVVNSFVKLSQPDAVADSNRADALPLVGSSSFTMLPIRTPQTYSSVTVKREEVGWKNSKSGLQIHPHPHASAPPINLQLNTLNQHHHPGMSTDNRLTQYFHGKVSGNQFGQADGGSTRLRSG